MEPFKKLNGIVAPLDRMNVDTDQIIPAVYLKSIERTGFGPNLFAPWRYNADGSPNPDFMLNDPAYRDAAVLVSGRNFGCGSSREHAPWRPPSPTSSTTTASRTGCCRCVYPKKRSGGCWTMPRPTPGFG